MFDIIEVPRVAWSLTFYFLQKEIQYKNAELTILHFEVQLQLQDIKKKTYEIHITKEQKKYKI